VRKSEKKNSETGNIYTEVHGGEGHRERIYYGYSVFSVKKAGFGYGKEQVSTETQCFTGWRGGTGGSGLVCG
jgi:hypothetical protein